jgi:putative transposase
LYPSQEQQIQLAQAFGCARWWWNYALNKSIETYKETGKGLSRAALNALLPALKKAEETVWLAECYSQVLQATTLNLITAYKNLFDKRAGFPKFKSRHGKQSIQYPQNVKIVDGNVKLPGNIGIVKAKIHRQIEGKVKTVTVSKTPSGKYLASILTELEGENPVISEGKIYGIDLGLNYPVNTSAGNRLNDNLSFCTSTKIVSPSLNSPRKMALAICVSNSR